VAVLLVYGALSPQGLRCAWDLVWSLALYPLWGVIQQGAVLGVAYPRFRMAAGERAAPVLAAMLFAAAHTPNPLLMGGGALMVLVYAGVWRKWPSLPVIAISHGVIGAVCDKALHVSMRVGAHYFAG
jgi:hypothetical protein